MKRKPLAFKQRDVTRAIRALQTSGVKCGRIEIKPDGSGNLVVDTAAVVPAGTVLRV